MKFEEIRTSSGGTQVAVLVAFHAAIRPFEGKSQAEYHAFCPKVAHELCANLTLDEAIDLSNATEHYALKEATQNRIRQTAITEDDCTRVVRYLNQKGGVYDECLRMLVEGFTTDSILV